MLRLGDEVLLEVIAIDPAARPPSRPRWFGLDDSDHVRNEWDAGRRLRAWVAQTDDIGTVLRSHSDLLGEATPVSRGERTWRFTLRHDGQLPAGGIFPPVIDWSPNSNPARDMPEREPHSAPSICLRLNLTRRQACMRRSGSAIHPPFTRVSGSTSLRRSKPRAESDLFRSLTAARTSTAVSACTRPRGLGKGKVVLWLKQVEVAAGFTGASVSRSPPLRSSQRCWQPSGLFSRQRMTSRPPRMPSRSHF